MGLRCFIYTMIYEAKRFLAGFKEIGPITGQVGVVSDVSGYHADWDFCFDLVDIVPEHDFNRTHYVKLHCEITICDRERLQPFIDKLTRRWNQGDRNITVKLSGQLAYDPAHIPGLPTDPNLLEIHPVTAAQFV